jgi:hypothetical protein
METRRLALLCLLIGLLVALSAFAGSGPIGPI